MLNRLFVYGIFLDERQRQAFGMANPHYATVKDYVTYGSQIVVAHHQANAGLALTGLVVTMDPTKWGRLDALEHGYNRILITTTDGDRAYMYAGKEYDDNQTENSNT